MICRTKLLTAWRLYSTPTTPSYTNMFRLQNTVTSYKTLSLIMHVWSQRNNIRFNTSKCKVLTVTRKKTPIAFDYILDGTALTRVSEEKDFGVTSTLSLWKQTSFLVCLNGLVPYLLASLFGAHFIFLWSSHSCVTPPNSGRPLTLLWMLRSNRCKHVQSGGFYARAETSRRTKSGWLC